MNRLRLAKIRAALGCLFVLFGLGIGVEILVRPGPKLLGLAFAVVLVALGVVRVRAYLLLKNELAP
ncbi:MAG: hypothetical protein ABSH03_07990 [Candidatus Lustribacter sp.]